MGHPGAQSGGVGGSHRNVSQWCFYLHMIIVPTVHPQHLRSVVHTPQLTFHDLELNTQAAGFAVI